MLLDQNGVYKFGILENTSITLDTHKIEKENLHLFDPKFKEDLSENEFLGKLSENERNVIERI